MKFVTFLHGGATRAGIVDGDTVRALEPDVQLVDLLGDGGERLHAAGEAALQSSALVIAANDCRLIAPIPHPTTVRDYMTFEKHVEGVAMLAAPGSAVPPFWYEAPAFYFSNPNSMLGPDDDVPVPPGSSMFDFELEVAAIIGRGGQDLSPEEAEASIVGYMLMNDWSARDLQFAEMSVRLGPAKGKDTSISLGPWLVTPDELEGLSRGNAFDITLTVHVNGQLVGEDNLSNMGFTFGQMIAYASRGTEVRPGDIFGSGTCGEGCLAEWWGRSGNEFHRPLAPGDVVVLDAGPLGRQTSRIVGGVGGIDFNRFRARSR